MSFTITGDWDELDLSPQAPERYVLVLYVAGASTNSARAITNLRAICEAHLPGLYELEIIDVQNNRTLATREQIIALPMLVRMEPLPKRRLIGDMSNTQQVLRGLGLL